MLLLDVQKDVVTVPIAAVQRGAPGTYVYLVNENSIVSVHPIKLGAQDGGFFAVESGLDPGDRVVTDGADRLRDGAHVTIPDKAQAQPGNTGGRKWPRNPGAAPAGEGQNNRQHHRHQDPAASAAE